MCGTNRVKALLACLFSLALAGPVHADFIDAQWTVVGFSGEAWYINTNDVIGQSQTFNRGFAVGIFYNCEYSGQSSTYTKYENDSFFANPEFRLFLAERDSMTLSSESLFVHRITCEGDGDPARRTVMYPFVTNETRKSSWYLFEGGVFSLFNP
jgi:hypothetical protein